MSRVIALYNQCGGVGKSTLTMNLGYHLQERSHRVLLIDIDPQASLTIFMGCGQKPLVANENENQAFRLELRPGIWQCLYQM